MVPVNFNIEGYVRSLQNDTVSISFIIVTYNSHLFFISHSWFGKAYVPPFADSFGLVEQHFVSFLYYSFKLGTAEIRAHYSHPSLSDQYNLPLFLSR